jgi:PAS domain S-box-containing protein
VDSAAAQVSFAAELVTMLVALAGVVLVARGREMAGRDRLARGVLGTGFGLLGLVSFLHGSVIVAPGGGLSSARLVACAVILAGALLTRPPWPASGVRRAFLLLGLVLISVASLVELGSSSNVTSAVLLGVGALTVGVPVALAGRAAIATRVAVATAATLLLVLVVVSVAMSTVISSSVQSTDLSRMAERATVQGYTAADQVNSVIRDARLEAIDLIDYFHAASPNPLAVLGTGSAQAAAAAEGQVQERVTQASALYPVSGGGFAYVLPSGSLALASGDLAPTVQGLARIPGVLPTTCPGVGTGRLEVVGGHAYAVGGFAECSSASTVLGTVLAVTPLDDRYLADQRRPNPSVGLALVAGGRTLASSGPALPGGPALAAWAAAVAASGTSSATTLDGHFVAVQPVAAGGVNGLQLVASSTESALVSTRDQLFRTLFLVALGSSVVALALAVLLGERITAGLRRLTDVVGEVGATPAGAMPRSGALSPDEVGVLGRAFDRMIDEVEVRAADLQAAADDETRLRNRLEAVVAGIADGLVATDITGRIIECNAAAERLLGVRAAEVLGAPVGEVLVGVGEDARRLAERLGRPSPSPWQVEADISGAGERVVPVAVSAGATRGPSGEIIGSVLVVRDLRSEQELERMKTEFLSRVGHELRTPLTGIMGYADILSRRTVDPERAHRWYTEILGGARRLLRIVEMLEFFASAGAGRVRLRPEALDPASLVAGVAAKWSAALGSGHTIVRRIHDGTPPILADRRWLVMALDELLDNAAKFSPSGGRIALCAAPAGSMELSGVLGEGELRDGAVAGAVGVPDGPEEGGGSPGWVEIAVVDHGEGMTLEQQTVAFGEFVQVDSSDTRRFGGLGLGLALVKRVVEGHGGTVTVWSEAGEGSAFVLRLPTAPGARRGR